MSPYLAAALVSLAATSAASARTYTIASYNVENFWDADPDNTRDHWRAFKKSLPPSERQGLGFPLQYHDYSYNGSNWYDAEVLRAKIDNLITALKLAGRPTIVGLQELESASNHSAVFDTPYRGRSTLRTRLRGLGYRYIYLGEQEADNPVSVTTAVISRVPLTAQPSVEIRFGSGRSPSARDMQVVEWTIGRDRLLLLNGHWKSKRGGRASERLREHTAREVRARIAEEREKDPRVHIVVLGDLNAAHFESPLQALGATFNERRMLKGPVPDLYNLWYELPRRKRWEYSFDGLRSTLSHILVSDTLYNTYGLSYVDQSFRVIGQSGPAAKVLLNAGGIPFRWQVAKGKGEALHVGHGYSDHLPLVATFQYRAYRGKQRKRRLHRPRGRGESHKREKRYMNFPEVDMCRSSRAVNAASFGPDLARALGECVELRFSPPRKMGMVGRYRSNTVKVGSDNLVLTMTRSWDWRPNLDDSRVSKRQASIRQGKYRPSRPHPRSNRCYVRKVLQGKGGKVRRALGRLGYVNGRLSLVVATREHLELSSLPAGKREACDWDDV